MIVMGLDIATSTGVGLIDPCARPSSWRCLAIEAEGMEPWDKAADLSTALRGLVRDCRPDFAVIERPLGVVVEYGRGKNRAAGDDDKRMINAKTTITLAALAGAAITVLEGAGVPWAMIAAATWRSAYFGKGRKPDDWKAAAIQMAELQSIPLPATVKAARDAAESIGIAVAWQKATLIPRQHQKAFMALRMGTEVPA